MRKASVSIGSIRMDFEYEPSELAEIIRQAVAAAGTTKDEIFSHKPEVAKSVMSTIRQVPRSRRSGAYALPEWSPIGTMQGELRGRENRNSYELVRHTVSEHLVGIIRNSRGTVVSKVSLGREDDPDSKISQVTKSIMTLTIGRSFTRRELTEMLPSHLATGNVLKFAMHYLVDCNVLQKLKERDIATGAIRYVRVGGSNQQTGQDADGATVRNGNGGVMD